jgi:hypothetical protein
MDGVVELLSIKVTGAALTCNDAKIIARKKCILRPIPVGKKNRSRSSKAREN